MRTGLRTTGSTGWSKTTLARIDITGRDKAEVLQRLYNGGFMEMVLPPTSVALQLLRPVMTLEQAREIVAENPSLRFDYIEGRSLKVDLSQDSFDPWLYDRDHGPGLAARALGVEET